MSMAISGCSEGRVAGLQRCGSFLKSWRLHAADLACGCHKRRVSSNDGFERPRNVMIPSCQVNNWTRPL